MDELKDDMKRQKKEAIINALLIGFLIGIVIYSIARNTVGLFTLIPLFFIYKFVKRSKNKTGE